MSYKYTCIGRIPSNWNIFSLKECTTKITDGTHSTVKDNPEGEYFLLSCKNIKSGKIVLGEKERKIDYQTLSKLRTRTGLSKDDILLTTVGTIGESSIIKDENIDYEFQRSVAIIRPNKEILLPKFLYYTTKSNRFKGQALGMVSGSVQKCLFLGAIGDIKVPIPSLEEQEKIVNILSSLDDKIELNNEMNKTLEDMAQSIFKRWFVDFEFPNEDGEPYKSSGGEMVDSELGMIPKGWEVRTIGDLCEIGSSKRIFMKEYVDSGITFFRGKEIIEKSKGNSVSTELFITEARFNELKDKFGVPAKNDILLTSVGTLGIAYLVGEEEFYFKDGNLTWFKNFKDEVYRYYIYQWLISSEGKKSIDAITIGSTQKALTINALKGIKLVLPSDKILKLFEGFIVANIDSLRGNNEEKTKLIELRDSILPKLMNGEIKLN